mgnify:FL=1
MKTLEEVPGVPKVTCLCATKGRYELLRSAVSYFLLQDYPNKELLIFNNHQIPINLSEFLKDQCNIRVINAGELESIHDVYNTALTHIDSLTEFVSIWDDDDVYLPWHLSTGMEFLCKGTHWAWQPREQLLIDDHLEFYPKMGAHRNNCEGSIIVKHSLLKKYGFGSGEDTQQLQHPHPTWTNEIIYNLGGFGYSSWKDNSYAYFWSDKNRHKPFYTHLTCGNRKGTQDTDTGEKRPLYPGATYFDYVIKNLHLKSYDQEYTLAEKQEVINRINKYNWRFYEERKLFTFWDGELPYFVKACINTMENNSNCVFELWDSKKLKKEFKDIPPEYDNLCVEFKADYARNRILYERGGMWLDADMLVVGDLYDEFMKHTWDHDSVMATEDPNHTWITINCGALCARPRSITFKKALLYINKIIKGHTVHWGDILNHGTKMAVRDTTSTHAVKYLDRDVVSLKIVQSPLGGFDILYKSPTMSLNDVIAKNTKVVTLHGSNIRHEVSKMPDEYLLQRMINRYTSNDFKSINYRGFKFITCDDFKSSISLSACEPFEEEINFISKYCKVRGDVYLDVGAHHGTWSLPLSRVFKHVHAFEACTENKNILEQNVLNNNINNIYIRNIAVGEADGKAFVSQHAPHNSGCFVTCDSGDEAVDQKKLDSFDLGHIAFLKIDVEGSELNVLKGAKKLIQNNKPLICVEINELSEINFGIQETSLFVYLETLGYKKVFEWGCNNYFAIDFPKKLQP